MTNKTIRTLGTGGAIGDTDLFLTRQGADIVDKSVTGTQVKTYTRGALSASAPVTYDSGTGAFALSGTKAQFDAACSDGNFLYVGDVTQYTDEMAQDAVGGMVNTTLTYSDATPSLGINLGNSNAWTVTQTFNQINADTLHADSSAGLLFEANGGADCLLIGAGGGANATAYGGWNFDGATADRIAGFGPSKTLVSLDTATYPSLTELSYVKGLTSAIQTQINSKAPTASPTFTGTVTLPAGQVVNGVTLSTAQGTGNFLRGDGTYAAPTASVAWGGITGTLSSQTDLQSALDAKAAAAFATGFGIVIDGAGSAITTGSKGFVIVPFAMTVTGWTITSDQTGSIVVDIKRSTYSGFPTTSSIAGTEKPTLSSAQKNEDNTLSSWTTSISAGDIIEFVVDSAATVQRVNITVKGTRA